MRLRRDRGLAGWSVIVLAACTQSHTSDAGRTDSGSYGAGRQGQPCDLGAVWVGDVCTVVDCSARPDLAPCRQADGDAGECLGASCRPVVDVGADPANCGGLGAVCPVGASCASRECSIDGGLVESCSSVQCPAGYGCLDAFCTTLSCAGAADDVLCTWDGGPEPWGHCCSGACRSFDSSPGCGGCGVVCPTGYGCSNESCQPIEPCAAGDNRTLCGLADGGAGVCCNGACTDLLADSSNCGNCGVLCPGQSHCLVGACRQDAGPGGSPFPECADAGCPVGTLCSTGFSCQAPGCGLGTEGNSCVDATGSAEGTCCSGVCSDTFDDPRNCGGCGIACAPGTLCVNNDCTEALDCSRVASGACAWDGGPFQGSCCEGRCVPNLYVESPGGDADCGRCGAGCPARTHCGLFGGDAPICISDDAGPAFPPPGCAPDTCAAGLGCTGSQCYPTDCTGLAAQARCSIGVDGGNGICCEGSCNPQSSDANCGRCGVPCPVGATCVGGGCNVRCGPDAGVCPPGSLCNVTQRECLASDCATLGAGALCAVTELDGSVQEGLCCGGQCIDPRQDPSNCGGCGATCASGACGGSSGDCLTDVPAPCVVSCGPDELCSGATCLTSVCQTQVEQPCASIAGTVGVCCVGGACADLLIDPGNCGRCGAACPPGHGCAAGSCTDQPDGL